MALRKEVQADWDRQERQNAVAQALAEAQGLLNQGFVERAIPLLETALRRYPGDSDLGSALASAREMLAARRREEEVRQRITEAEGLAAALHFDRALKALDKALKSYPGEPELLRSRQAILDAHAAHNQAKTRQETLQKVDKLHHRGRFDDALRLIEPVLSQFPEDPDLLAAKRRIESDWEARKRRDAVEQVLGEAQRLLSQRLHDRATALIEDSLRQYPDDPRLSSLLARARQELQTRQEADIARQRELAAQQARPAPLAAPSSPVTETVALPRPRTRWSVVLTATAAVAVLTVGIVMVWRQLHPRMVSLEVRTEPPGARVRINERSCGTPTCRFDLPPGTYRIEARMSGFRPAERSVTLDARKPSEPVTIPLEPEAAPAVELRNPPETRAGQHMGTLLVRTDTAGAEVFIDGVNNGRTDRAGVLRLSLSAQEHLVRVEKMGFRAPAQQRLTITEGSTTVIPFNLTPQNAPVNQGAQEAKIAPPTPVPSGAPRPPEAPKAADPAAAEWEQVRNSRDREALEAYLRKYPANPHTAEAQTRIEDLAWNGVNRTDINALRDFVHKYPSGAHGAEARLAIEKLDWEAVQRIAADRDKARQATAEQLNHDRQSIIKALQRFSAAIESQNPDEIKVIFPNMSLADLKPYQQKDLKFEVSLQMLSNPEIAGDKATVDCKRAVVTTYRGRVRPPKVDHVQVNLDRSGGSWIIVSVIAR
jgi:tetratricopeptide (TPR) repeat protein